MTGIRIQDLTERIGLKSLQELRAIKIAGHVTDSRMLLSSKETTGSNPIAIRIKATTRNGRTKSRSRTSFMILMDSSLIQGFLK